MSDQNWPAMIADIGGTNARFAMVDGPSAAPRDLCKLMAVDYPTLDQAMTAYLDGVGAQPRTGCIAVAGPVDGDRFTFTNSMWRFSIRETKEMFGFEKFNVINDFQALALSVPRLSEDDVHPIGMGTVTPNRPIAVVGPGTGLGVGMLIPDERGGWLAFGTEGGHVDLAPIDDFEIEVYRAVRHERSRISAETVLSGSGLDRLYRGVCAALGTDADPLDAPTIVNRGAVDPPPQRDPRCMRTMEVFCALLGSFCGNVALTIGAKGGVVLGGGILPRMVSFLEDSQFRERFLAKGRMADYLATIPTKLIIAKTPALTGIAAWLAAHDD